MTDTAVRADEAASARPASSNGPHPLDPATAAEYLAGRDIMAAAGLLAEPVRFAYYGLEEPPKDEVLASADTKATDRRLRAFLVNTDTGESTDVVVSLTHTEVVSTRRLDPGKDGQMPILDSDYAAVDEITKTDPQWRAAMARRGYHDLSQIRCCPITAGVFGVADDDRRRMVRVLAFVQAGEHDLAWAHPVDGVAAYVDLVEKKVFKVTDEFELPVPAESGDYDDEAVRGPHRTTLKPIEITQPEGPSFTLDGHALRWQDWSMRIGFDLREGLTLHQVSLNDGGRERPVLYRASIPEMVVPYGDPKFRYWQAYFDTGEYLVGKWVNSLELGCDCLGEIAYLDATVTDDTGQPRTVPNAICIHEEDFGILWKHTDIFNGSAASRRQRRLVVSYFTTVGNYDYGFYWYFYLDGTIECEIKATGVLFTSAYPARTDPGGGPGGSSAPSRRTGSAAPPATRSARSRRRCCWPTRTRHWPNGPGSRPTTCGSPGTIRPTAGRPATSSTRIRAEPASPPSSPATRTSTAPTSSSGTRSAPPMSRARRTGPSCPSPAVASCSSRPVSSTATPPWTFRPRPATASLTSRAD